MAEDDFAEHADALAWAVEDDGPDEDVQRVEYLGPGGTGAGPVPCGADCSAGTSPLRQRAGAMLMTSSNCDGSMDFFPPPPDLPDIDELDELPPQLVWAGAAEDVVPGVVPVELVLGRSESTVVLLTGFRAFPTGLAMTLGVRLRGRVRHRDLHTEVFDGPYAHGRNAGWQAGRLKWGFELADGWRVTNVDPPPWEEQPHRDHSRPRSSDDWTWVPDHPVLVSRGGGGGTRSVDRDYWLWPLPPAGRLRIVCQWPDQGIETTMHDLDAQPFLDAAARSQSVWPEAR